LNQGASTIVIASEAKQSRTNSLDCFVVSTPRHDDSRRALQLLNALAVIAAALLQPLQPAIGVAGFIGLVLIEAGFSARPGFSFEYLASTAFGKTALLATAVPVGALLALERLLGPRSHCYLRKSFHFIPLRLFAVFASLYLALHSVIVSACAEPACIPRTAMTAAATNKA
jgi:hypothetical protein